MKTTRILLNAALVLSLTLPGLSQTVTKQPTAVTLATQALAALTGGLPVTDVTVNATATRFIGPDQQAGSATLQAKGVAQSKVELDLGTTTRIEVRTLDTDGLNTGQWSNDGTQFTTMAPHNCWTDAAWFFPPLGILSIASQPDVSITYVGRETRNGLQVDHLQFSQVIAGKDAPATKLIQTLSTVDLYLDANSHLPLVLTSNTHPDKDATSNVPVEIRFANYQPVSGIQVPFRIQKLFDGGLQLDLTVQSATINSGLAATIFSLK